MASTPPANAPAAQPAMSRDEQIGYHKGAIATLIAERNELLRLVSITESLLQAHLQELEKLGIKLPVKSNAQPQQ